jgi:hypothetical protein
VSNSYYQNSIKGFVGEDPDSVLGKIVRHNQFDLNNLQRNTWKYEINYLRKVLKEKTNGHIFIEYTIPRIGKRVDVVLIIKNVLFLIEFKVGESEFHKSDMNQVMDYALDLKYFHKESADIYIIPILLCTKATDRENHIDLYGDKVVEVLLCGKDGLTALLDKINQELDDKSPKINAKLWEKSNYYPTPTIIEAAQSLYSNHNVKDISHSDSGAYNLSETTETVKEIIKDSKQKNQKSIIFVTGVPGAGKTLAGINIANEMHDFTKDEHAVFLSGNQPLVRVLQEALARDEKKRTNARISDARRKTQSFIQIIHHYRDEFVGNNKIPAEHVVIFDEAQRAWTKEQIVKFMAQKKGIADFEYSEPEFLISTVDRHKNWGVVVCLVGGGQEINTGEAGLSEWFAALKRSFSNWRVYIPEDLNDTEYLDDSTIKEITESLTIIKKPKLHLATSIRSFRSKNVSEFVKDLLGNDIVGAKETYRKLAKKYPIVLTRDLTEAKRWVKQHARGTERYGLIASSNGLRLKADGVFVKNSIDAANWFLNDDLDVRSSYYLEDVATEFDIQGLELDWSIVAWDLDLRRVDGQWSCHSFSGSRWNKICKNERAQYLINSYRVLLTRARQGLVIYVPAGSEADRTRPGEQYNEVVKLFLSIGISEI